MAFINNVTKQINCKIVYWGPPNSGKSSNLKALYRGVASEFRTGLYDLSDVSKTSCFECLPLSVGQVAGYKVRFNLYSMDSGNPFSSIEEMVLRGIDGLVLVFDSRLTALRANLESLDRLESLMLELGLVLSDIPRVVQYNKQDVEGCLGLEYLKELLNPLDLDDHKAVAVKSIGTAETLLGLVRKIMVSVRIPCAFPQNLTVNWLESHHGSSQLS